MATETDGAVEVLKEIRDELRNVRTELAAEMRSARAGVRTERVDRAGRWRMAGMASTGAMAFVALVLALRAGRQPSAVVMPAPVMVAAAPAPSVAPAPAVTPAPFLAAPVLAAVRPAAKLAAAKPVSAKPVSSFAAVVPAEAPATAAPQKRAKPAAAKPAAETAPGDDDETMAFSPRPRRVRVHKMSYGPVESEPAKL